MKEDSKEFMKIKVKDILVFLRRRVSLMLIAFMLGMSNVILEESRSVNDTREHIEQPEVFPDEDLNNTVDYLPDF
ncbi:hypothetical protein [Maribacter halichondriae]|uniref:hypothetical protein n=1 Tax=Maribacter halichondriae TaxID=2980554 RepID=UPI00235821DB|nr:hypothetical protein [Maribacter sp. Hal144]